jgi:hypothetical protein
MRDRGYFSGDALAANECAPSYVAADEAFGFEFGVGVRDGGAVNAQLRGEFAACGNAFSRTQIASVNQGADLIAQLDVERDVAFGLEMERNHWLVQSGQSIISFSGVKSQFVFCVFSSTGFSLWGLTFAGGTKTNRLKRVLLRPGAR